MGISASAVKSIGNTVNHLFGPYIKSNYQPNYSQNDLNLLENIIRLPYMTHGSWAGRLVLINELRELFYQARQMSNINFQNLNQRYNRLLIEPIFKMQLHNKISEIIQNYSITDQGRNEICWSHAIATAIHLSQSRIVGREAVLIDEILQRILSEFGYQAQKLENVMRIVLPRFKLHYKQVNPINLTDIIVNSRVCVADFWLNGTQWYNFSKFFNDPNNKKRAITANDINRKPKQSEIRGVKLEEGGHVVVLIDMNKDELTFMNSWGENWGDNGIFRVKLGAFDINFYDIFWYESDLSKSEIRLWNERCQEALQTFYQIIDGIEEEIEESKDLIYTAQVSFILEECSNLFHIEECKEIFPGSQVAREVLSLIGYEENDENNKTNKDYMKKLKRNSNIVINGSVIRAQQIDVMVTILAQLSAIHKVDDQLHSMINQFWRIEKK